MIIKKFQGKTKEEALESAKKELGESIVEMNVKTIKAKGVLGIFKGTKIEVTVAKEEENEKYGLSSSKETQKDGVAVSISQSTSQGKIIPMKQPEKLEITAKNGAAKDAKAVGQAVADVLSSFPPQKADSVRTGETINSSKQEVRADEPTRDNLRGNGLEEKLDNLQTLLEKQLSQKESKMQVEDFKSEEREKPEQNNERTNFL